jgi:hypothetical protein
MPFRRMFVNQRSSRRRLAFESLEARRLMAVTTSLNNGTLSITGDAAADDIAVVGTPNPGEFTIMGRNGTTVDGMASLTIPGVTADLFLDLRDGDNVVDMDNVYIARDIVVVGGSGDDLIRLGETSPVSPARDLTVVCGPGDDVILQPSYHVFVGRDSAVVGALDNDSIVLTGASALGSISVVTHAGSQNIVFDGCTAGVSLTVSTFIGADNIAILRSSASQYISVSSSDTSSIYLDTVFAGIQLALATGGDAATVTLARSSLAQASISTHGLGTRVVIYGNQVTQDVLSLTTRQGNDQVEISYNVANAGLNAYFAEGDDLLTLIGNSARVGSFDGGPGINRLTQAGNLFGMFSTSNFI